MRSYSYLMSDADGGGGHYVELQESKLFYLIRLLLEHVDVDETWYLKQNSDVADAVKSGALKSAKHHYIVAGYFENRLPRPVEVDEAWYLAEYPDVAAAIKSGAARSARDHFMGPGFLEGRLPRKDWSLLGEKKLEMAG
ncbi:hypothetical protein [Acidocella sp.]|uniref:hypothetical protein n=1 Tax=Acidocella sp. TaxID=50710 RepID=UPI0026152E4E|nr:hypothetical protein [Acidocella sp.]